MYLDTYFKLTYNSTDNITHTLKELGLEAMLFKADLSRTFRHISIDNGDIDVLGIQKMIHHGSTFFQHCSDATHLILCQHGFPHLWNYTDDIIYTGLPSHIYPAY